jgi:preprotein translocase subunit YajC
MLDNLIFALGAPAATAPAPVTAPVDPAAAAAGATAGATGTPAGGNYFFLILLGFLVLMYLMMYIPERRRRKKLQETDRALKQGDKVMTSSGIVGVIEYIGDKTVYIRSQDAKIEVVKETIATILQ